MTTKIIVFCGGSGTRMWPMSRTKFPKQLQPFIGEKTLFRQTVDRLLSGFKIEELYISAGKNHIENILKEVPDLPKENLIIEPVQRDTLACVGYAVARVHRLFADSIIFTMWSDHYIRNENEFIKAIKTAESIVRENNAIVNIDAKPTSPNVNLGYMELGKLKQEINGFSVYELIRQVEKPTLDKANEFVRSYRYLWHTGYTVFRSDIMLDLYKKHVPEVYDLIQKIILEKNEKKCQELFEKIPKISIDFAIYEKVEKGRFLEIPADLGWTDVGAWNVLKDELAENGKALVVKGKNYDLGSLDCLIYELNKDKIIATIGCENLVIVDTPDALLVCSKFKAQEVKKIVEKLKSEGEEKYL